MDQLRLMWEIARAGYGVYLQARKWLQEKGGVSDEEFERFEAESLARMEAAHWKLRTREKP